MKTSFRKNKIVWIIVGLLLVGAVITALLLSRSASEKAETEAPVLQTAKVRRGDLVVSSAGSGSVITAAQTQLGFRTSGVVSVVNVEPGQQVSEGDILASLDNATQQTSFIQAEANLESIFSDSGIAKYQLKLSEAQLAYDKALGESNVYDPEKGYENEIAILKNSVLLAQKAVEAAEYNDSLYLYYPEGDLYKAKASADLADAKIKLEKLLAELAYYELEPVDSGETKVMANLEIARARLGEAQTALEIVHSGDLDRLPEALAATEGTALFELKLDYLAYENARMALENTNLVAPYDGVVGNLNLVPGQSVSTSPVLTLTSMDELLVKFYMDETDLSGLSVGNRTIYTFSAHPETTFEGEVAAIEPSLQMIDGSAAVVAWGTLPEKPNFYLLIGMTIDVEIIAGEAKNALLIPVQALREITPESFAVFVVQEDGSLKLTPVTIGLRDFANAEVLAGLEAGDVISTGSVETE